MQRKYFAALVALIMIAMALGCASGNKPFLTTAMETKVAAEDALYYARAFYNAGRLSEQQFNSVRQAYDALYVVQNSAIDARIAYLKMPADATAEQKYKVALAQVTQAALKFTEIALALGLINQGQTIDPAIPIRQ